MERLTLDKAIKHAKEVAKTNLAEATYNFPDLKEYYDNCSECANQHNQLAQWLEELKEYKELEEKLCVIFAGDCSLSDVVENLERQITEPDKDHPVNARILTYEDAEKWNEYMELEEQGLLVRLPCKVGDKAWDNDFGYPESYEIKAFSYGYCDSYVEPDIEDQIIFYYENYSGSIAGAFPMSEIGKTVFLTREEAEKKLEEMKKNE